MIARGAVAMAWRYALATACIGAAVLLHVSPVGPLFHPIGAFLLGVVAAAWFGGGAGPGVFAALLSALVLPHLIASGYPPFAAYPALAGVFDLWHFLTLGVTGAAVGWGTSSYRERLERTVAERTAALRESEGRNARAMEATAAGHWEWDLVTHQVFHSPRFRELYGIGPDEKFADRDAWKARQPLSATERERQEEALQAAIADPTKDYDIELSFEVCPGELRWLRSRGKVFRDAQGRALRISGATSDITPQKLAQQALHESEKRYERVILAADAGFWEWDVVKDEFHVSPRLLENGGMPAGSTFAGRADFMRRAPFHPEDREKWQQAVKALFASGDSRLSMEMRLIVGVEPRWYRLDGMCFRDADGKVLRWTGSSTDVTERKSAEMALRQSEERYARVMQASEDGFWEWIVATDAFYASPRMLAIYGLPPDTAFRGLPDFLSRFPFHREDLDSWRNAVAAHLAGQTPRVDIEARAKLKGGVRWIHLAAVCQRDALGAEERWTGSVSDVTERRRAQEALRVSEERYAHAMEGSDAGHWDWNIVSDEMFVSQRARDMLALPPGALPASRAEIMSLVPMHQDDRAAMDGVVEASIQSGIHERDYRVIPRPGEVRWLRSRAKIYKDASGAAVRMTGSILDITERKLAAEALRASEERYSLAMAAAEEGHFDIDLDTDELFISERLNEIYGFPPATRFARRGEYLERFRFYGNDAETYHAALAAAVAKGGPERYEFEYRILRPSGEVRWLMTRGKVIRDAAGNARRRTGVVADITARKLAEDAVRLSEQRYARAMDAAEAGHWEWNVASDEMFVSARQREMLGLPPELRFANREAYLASIPFHPDDRARYIAGSRRHIDDVWPRFEQEFRVIVKGSTRWMRLAGKSHTGADGKPTHFTGSLTDITEAKLAEEALRLSEERYALAMRASGEGHWDWKVDSDEFYASPRYLEIGGFPPDTPYARRADIVERIAFHPDDRAKYEAAVAAHFAGETPRLDIVVRIVPHGEVRWLHVIGLCTRDADGRPVRWGGSVNDITARKRAEAALRLSEERYALALEASEEGHFDNDLETGEIFVSARLNEMYGFPPQAGNSNRIDFINKTPFHPDDRSRVLAELSRPDGGERVGDLHEIECRIIPRPGETRWIHSRAKVMRDAEGRPRRRVGVVADITERKLAEALLSGEKHILECVAKGEPLQQVLDDLCRLVEDLAPGVLASILLLEGNRLRHGGAPSLPKAYTDLIDGAAIGPSAGSCGTAAYRGQQVIVSDIATDALWAEYRALALPHGLRACWSTPVLSPEGKVIATFAMYYREPRSPAARDQLIIEQIGHLAGVAIQHKLAAEGLAQSEKELRLSEERYALAMEAAQDAHWDFKIGTDEYYTSPRVAEVFGLPPGTSFTSRQDYLANTPLVKEDLDAWLSAARELFESSGSRLSMDLRAIIRGEVHWIQHNGVCFRDASGRAVRWCGSVRDVTERRRAQEALRLSEERYALAMEASEEGHFDWDVQTDEIFASAPMKKLFGLPLQQEYRTRAEMSAQVRYYPGDLEQLDQTNREVLASDALQSDFEYRILRGDEVRWVRRTWMILRDASGAARRVNGVLTDITERKLAEEALRLSEERYALAMAASEEGHFDWNVRTDEIFASAHLKQLLDLPEDAPLRTRTDMVSRMPFYRGDGERVAAMAREVLAGGALQHEFAYRLLRGEGEPPRWIEARWKIFRDANGAAERVIGVVSDITERRRVEEALRESEERYAVAVDGASQGIFDWDLRNDRVFHSRRAQELFGLEAGESWRTRREWAAMIRYHPEDVPRIRTSIRRSLDGEKPMCDDEYRVVRRDGELRWLHQRGVVVRDASGKPYRMAGSIEDITERKVAAEALRRSQLYLAEAQSLSHIGSWAFNVDGFKYWSPELFKIHGLDPGGKAPSIPEYLALVHAEDRDSVVQEIEKVLAGAEGFDFKKRIVRPDGEIRHVRCVGIRAATGGNVQEFVGSGMDVTEQDRAEEALRKSEERFSLAVAGSNEGIFDWDLVSDRVYVSYRAQELFGLPRGELWRPRRDWRHIVTFHPEDAPRLHDAIKAHIEGSSPTYDFDFRIFVGGGGVRWYRQRGIALRDASGKAYRLVGSIGDITEGKRAEEELRSRQEMLELAQKAARAVPWEWVNDAPPEANRWSDEMCALFGLPPGGFDGTTEGWWKLCHPDDRPRVKASIAHALASGEIDVEYRVTHADGEVRWLHQKGRAFLDANGKPLRSIGFMLDVTERKQAEQELRQLEQKLRGAQRLEGMGTLAGGIAHDFNNILGAIVGYGEMALRESKKGSRLRRDLDAIMAAGERGRALVDRILAFSRSGVGERVPVHVEEVVREALDQLAAKLPENVTIAPRLHAERAAMLGDSTQVHQVVMNLANNGVQAMPNGGVLRVALETVRFAGQRPATVGALATGDYIVLKVSDGGTGIPPDVLERMFDPFFTTKEVGVGSGLGLSLVHGIVSNVGGAIDVATELGKGSSFTVYLPRTGDAPAKAADRQRPMPRGDGQRVLVVDDEEPLVRLATETLERLGYTPVGFTSSTAALAAFRADPQRFDALLTDERMPGLSGTALIREVRGIRDSIPVVLMSGYLGMTPRDAPESGPAVGVGADVVVKKPLSARELAASLARALGH